MNWKRLKQQVPSPLQELHAPLFREKGIRFLVKRDDLLCLPVEPGDCAFSGNKWRKLKYNLFQAKTDGFSRLLTFGGAYSNHVAATAAAGKLFGFNTLGIIRGEPHLPLNPSLSFADQCGMKLFYLDRTRFRNKESLDISVFTGGNQEKVYVLPEGGTNPLALEGCAELAEEILNQEPPDVCCVSCGTGGTMAGLIRGFQGKVSVLGFPALKGAFLAGRITDLLGEAPGGKEMLSWDLCLDYHFGGYAKFTPALLDFIREFEAFHQIPLDPVYTAKLFFGVIDLIRKDSFPRGTTLCVIHSGGLQGNAGFEQRFGTP